MFNKKIVSCLMVICLLLLVNVSVSSAFFNSFALEYFQGSWVAEDGDNVFISENYINGKPYNVVSASYDNDEKCYVVEYNYKREKHIAKIYSVDIANDGKYYTSNKVTIYDYSMPKNNCYRSFTLVRK